MTGKYVHEIKDGKLTGVGWREDGKKLHLGSGDRRLSSWVNCDNDYSLYETGFSDKLLDASSLHEFNDNTVDEIYASHLLDHFSRNKELDKALSEWYRVLKPDGILRVAVSNFEMVAKMYIEGLDLERLWGHIVGGHKSEYDKHGCVFDFALLKKYLEKHNFTDIERYRWQDFLPEGFDDLSRAYIPHLDFKNGILMSLNVRCKK